jgi:hypothetical protein
MTMTDEETTTDRPPETDNPSQDESPFTTPQLEEIGKSADEDGVERRDG